MFSFLSACSCLVKRINVDCMLPYLVIAVNACIAVDLANLVGNTYKRAEPFMVAPAVSNLVAVGVKDPQNLAWC